MGDTGDALISFCPRSSNYQVADIGLMSNLVGFVLDAGVIMLGSRSFLGPMFPSRQYRIFEGCGRKQTSLGPILGSFRSQPAQPVWPGLAGFHGLIR